jgi:hypothetical protein
LSPETIQTVEADAVVIAEGRTEAPECPGV